MVQITITDKKRKSGLKDRKKELRSCIHIEVSGTGKNIGTSRKEPHDSDVIQEANRINHSRMLHGGKKGNPDRERQTVQRDDRTAQKRL
jgi:hypothetical protein